MTIRGPNLVCRWTRSKGKRSILRCTASTEKNEDDADRSVVNKSVCLGSFENVQRSQPSQLNQRLVKFLAPKFLSELQ